MSDFAAKMTAHTDRYGKCPIEAGLVCNLADHECRHAHLQTDKVRRCLCFEPKALGGEGR
jgi:hypothetical protein